MKIACVTLDMESDYGQDDIESKYLIEQYLIENNDTIPNLLESHTKDLTVFLVGKLLLEAPEIIEPLKKLRAEVELHSFDHKMDRNPDRDLSLGVEAFKKALGKRPMGYRAPQGVIINRELRCLSENNFRFDSSVLPFFRPMKFWNFRVPQEPYMMRDYPLMELPISTVPRIRFPISFSYIMLTGWGIYERLFQKYGLPKIIVFNFHLHDLFKSEVYNKLSPFWRSLYKIIYKRNPWKTFKKFLQILDQEGYTFMQMEKLYELLK